jgi:hypothetical protein
MPDTRRSTPAFAPGGVPYHNGDHDQYEPGPSCGWRCFHCNCHFHNYRAALRHFGQPGSDQTPRCLEDLQ